MLSTLTGLFRKGKIKQQQLESLEQILRGIVSDGVVTDAELKSLSNFTSECGISPDEFGRVRNIVFNQVLASFSSDRRFTDSEQKSLIHLAQRLGVSGTALAQAKSQVDYFALLHNLETTPFEQLPHNNGSSGILLEQGEFDYFSHSAQLLEERVVRSRVVGNSAGVGFRVMKGVSFRVGHSRGHIQSERDVVPVSIGEFTITNKRLVFSGDRKSVNAPLAKLLDLDLFADGLRFSLTNRQKPVTVQFYSLQSTELAGLLISRILNQ